MSVSDASVVDYGVNINPASNFFGGLASRADRAGPYIVVKNDVPENKTSDFGVVWYPFGSNVPVKQERGIQVAMGRKTEGPLMTAGATTGVRSGGNYAAGAIVPMDKLRSLQGSNEAISEAAYGLQFVGQL